MAERKQYPSEKQDQYMLRFPDGLRDRLKELAGENKRSLNAEIIARLERTISADESGDPDGWLAPGKNIDMPPEEFIDLLDRYARTIRGRLKTYHRDKANKPKGSE